MKLNLVDDRGVLIDSWGDGNFPTDNEVIYDPVNSINGMPDFLKQAINLWRHQKLTIAR